MVNLIVNGISYPFPNTGDQVWGDTVTDWATAITNGTLQKSGGTFTLTGNANFGTSYGLMAKHFSSSAVNAATSGVIRLTNAEIISWRNNANTTDLSLTVNASDQLTYEGQPMMYAGAALTASRALATNGAGAVVSSAVTATELGYVSGVTSAIQTQLNTHTTNITNNATTAANAVTTHAALTTGVHGVAGNVLGTSDTQVITNKDIDGGTAANTRRVTIPKATKATLDALTRKESTLVYATDTAKAYVDNGTALVPLQRAEVTQSELIYRSGNGHGSTSTKIRRFSTTEKNTGTAITFADSATLGASFTINEAGLYAISYIDMAAAGYGMGITKNTSEPTISIQSLVNNDHRIAMAWNGAGLYAQCFAVTRLAAGDVIRAHTDGSPATTAQLVRFSIIKIGD